MLHLDATLFAGRCLGRSQLIEMPHLTRLVYGIIQMLASIKDRLPFYLFDFLQTAFNHFMDAFFVVD